MPADRPYIYSYEDCWMRFLRDWERMGMHESPETYEHLGVILLRCQEGLYGDPNADIDPNNQLPTLMEIFSGYITEVAGTIVDKGKELLPNSIPVGAVIGVFAVWYFTKRR